MQERSEAGQILVGNGAMKLVGTTRVLLEHGQALLIEAFDHIAHGLIIASELTRNRWGSLLARRSHQDLTTPQHKGFFGTEPCLKLMQFFFGKRTDKNGCFHAF